MSKKKKKTQKSKQTNKPIDTRVLEFCSVLKVSFTHQYCQNTIALMEVDVEWCVLDLLESRGKEYMGNDQQVQNTAK